VTAEERTEMDTHTRTPAGRRLGRRRRAAFVALTLGVLMFATGQRAARAVGTPAGTVISNQATISFKDANGNTQPDVTTAAASTTVAQVAGVDVSPKSSSQSNVPTSDVDYQVTITNTGNGTDIISLGSSSSEGYTTAIYTDSNADGVLNQSEEDAGAINDTGALEADATYRVIVVVSIPEDAANGTTDNTTITIISQTDGTVTDSGTYSTTVVIAELLMNKSVDVPTPSPGDTITYTITYTNVGTASAISALVVGDPIPENTIYIAESVTLNGVSKTDASDGDEITFDGTRISADIGTVAASATGTLVFQVTVDPGVPNGTSIVNSATADYEDASGTPQTIGSNTPPTTLYSPVIVGTKNVSPAGDQPPGATLTYTVVVSNTGDGDATDVVISDDVPANTSYVAGSVTIEGVTGFTDAADADDVTVIGDTINVSLDSIPAGQSKVIAFEVTID
jgi:uncharacterized repeat protein (TIGR01451 family)